MNVNTSAVFAGGVNVNDPFGFTTAVPAAGAVSSVTVSLVDVRVGHGHLPGHGRVRGSGHAVSCAVGGWFGGAVTVTVTVAVAHTSVSTVEQIV